MSEEVKKFDKNNNEIYHKHSDGIEYWYKYDKNNNRINFKGSSGYESWQKFDENNRVIYYKNSIRTEYWCKYDDNSNSIYITEQEYKNIEFRKKEKEYNSRTKCSRFEIMDI